MKRLVIVLIVTITGINYGIRAVIVYQGDMGLFQKRSENRGKL